MNEIPANLSAARHNQGFVLVTSLIFLVVVTLLAVSAINSSTVQETMASNLREKSRARQSADAALRQGEMVLEDAAFDTYQAPGSTAKLASQADNDDSNQSSLKVWYLRSMFGNGDDKPASEDTEDADFLADSLWKGGQGDKNEPTPYELDADMADAQYYVEDYACNPRDLNPDTCAVGDGAVLYRITARARGEKPAAVAVTQSLYEKHY